MQYEIRALKVGEVLDQAVQLTKNHFGMLFGIMACTVVPVQFAMGLYSNLITPQLQQQQQQRGGGDPIELLTMAAILIGLSCFTLIFVLPLANGAMIHGLASAYLSRPVTLGECMRHGLRRWAPLVWTSFLTWLAIAVGYMLCFIPAIFFALWFATLSQQITVLENSSGTAALGRSKELMKSNMQDAFVLGLVVWVISAMIGVTAAAIPEPHVAALLAALLQGASMAFATAAWVVFYFSVRCKLENFDLQLLAEAVDDDGSAGPPEPSAW